MARAGTILGACAEDDDVDEVVALDVCGSRVVFAKRGDTVRVSIRRA